MLEATSYNIQTYPFQTLFLVYFDFLKRIFFLNKEAERLQISNLYLKITEDYRLIGQTNVSNTSSHNISLSQAKMDNEVRTEAYQGEEEESFKDEEPTWIDNCAVKLKTPHK